MEKQDQAALDVTPGILKSLANTAKDAATKGSAIAGAAGQDVIDRMQGMFDSKLKPFSQNLKREVEEQLFGRLKAKLRKQFLYQWAAILVGVGAAIIIALLK